MKRRLIFSVFFLGLTHALLAQSYLGEANLQKVHHDGFYRIFLSPEITPFLDQDCSNARIVNQNDVEIPYILDEDVAYDARQYTPYEIVEKNQTPGCCTSLVVENTSRSMINNIHLVIRNAEVRKSASLLGSDDRTQWFALKDNFELENINAVDGSSAVRMVQFPLSRYAYYWLKINDSTSAPLNIESAGYYKTLHQAPSYTPLKKFKLVIKDSLKTKQSFWSVMLDTVHWVDRIIFHASGMPYFFRHASLYEKTHRRTNTGKTEFQLNYVKDFELKSGSHSVVDIPRSKGKEWIAIIRNEDNPPLVPDSIQVYQLNRYMVAYLKTEDSYKLKTGNDLQPPVYDLASFKNKIPQTADVIMPAAFRVHAVTDSAESDPPFFNSKLWIWAALIVIITVLAFMSVRMIRESNANSRQ